MAIAMFLNYKYWLLKWKKLRQNIDSGETKFSRSIYFDIIVKVPTRM